MTPARSPEDPTDASAERRRSGAAGVAVAVVLGIPLALAVRAPGAAPTLAEWSPGQATEAAPTPGGTWRVVHGPDHDPLWQNEPPDLYGIHGQIDDDGVWRGWAVGQDGALVRFDGDGWTPSTLDAGMGRIYQFRDIFAQGADDAWLVGHATGDRSCSTCGTLLRHDGTGWHPLVGNDFGVNGRVAPLNAIDMLRNPDGSWTGWVVGDDADFDNIKAIILQWLGDHWRVWSGSNNIAKHLYDVRVISDVEAWAVGQDGSESWYDAREGLGGWPRLGHSGVDTLFAVDLADPLFGWDGGVAGRMNHYAGSCHDETTDTQCWFDNQARPIKSQGGIPLAQDVEDIVLLSRTSGWLVGAPQSRLSLVAYLSGDEWRPVPVQDDEGERLRALHMVNAYEGWAVGDSGVILRYEDTTAPSPTPSTPTATSSDSTQTPTPGASEPSPTLDGTESTPSPSATTGATTPTEEFATSTPSPSQTATESPIATSTATPTATSTPSPVPVGKPSLFLPMLVTRGSGGQRE